MPDQDEPIDPKLPAEWDKGSGGQPIPAQALGDAIENFLEEGALTPEPPAGLPTDDLTKAALPARRAAVPNPANAEIDPLHPGAEVWQAIAHEADEEQAEKRHAHHPVPPEELPDISNL
jgi:hypothetical protein